MKIRVEKTKNYTVMSNYHFKEKDMSLKAMGLLSLLLNLPDTWEYTIEGLSHITKDGVDSIRSALKELERFGYLERERVRNSDGTLSGTEYIIHEYPIDTSDKNMEKPNVVEPEKTECENTELTSENPNVEKPILENPTLENPIQENPMQENPRQLNTNILNTNKLNINILNHNARRYYADDGLEKSFRAFIDMRKRIKKPLNDNSMRMIRKKLFEFTKKDDTTIDVDKAIAILDYSTLHNYPGIYEHDEIKKHNGSSSLGREYSKSQMDELEKKLLSN